MRRIAFIALACAGIAACSPTSTGTVSGAAVGATAGAVVGGPVGAVVGGTVGAVAGGSTGAATEAQTRRRMALASPGRCFVYDELGNQAIDRRGRPITTRC
jgi:outer membrane lipoprotein SlyB